MRSLIALTLFAVLSVFTCPLAARAVDFGGIAARPANPAPGDERTSSWFVYAMAAGEKKDDSLIVTNNTDAEQTLSFYPADSKPTTGSGFALKQQSEKMDAVGSWVKLDRKTITLAPRSQGTINFSVMIPANQPAGLWSGAIMASGADKEDGKAGINLNVRLGVRMYITTMPAVLAKKSFLTSIAVLVAAAAVLAAAIIAIKRRAPLKA